MPILPFMPLHKGYEPSAVELNHEEGVLEISHPSDCVLIEESKLVAETLILRCVIKPICMKDKTVKVRLISEGEVLEDTPLYEEESLAFGYEKEIKHSQWQGIALEYTGMGRGVYQGESFHFDGKTLPHGHIEIGHPLYFKPFKVDTDNHQERTTTLASGQILTSPPGALDAQVLRGYGGYYKEGIAPEEIQQVYYSLTSTHTQTRVRLFTSSTLHEQHTSPPNGGRDFHRDVIFNPSIQEEEYLSLSGAIATGYARLTVSTDWGKIQFLSYLCESVSGHPTFVNVYFHP